ncbi:MAG: macro domain-containing protein [Alphaproteobacteria bacterium]|nr:macro domain-containing protein [Alphaproteobacteria bacterium]
MTPGLELESIEADITHLALDAVVNAANEPLIRGGGVDGAIRRAAGTEIEAEIRKIGRCPTGGAVITRGYRLPARYVIHTVAPVWSGSTGEDALLARCYRSALGLAEAHALSSIAFPCIGTGIYGWPPEQAAQIAFDAVAETFRASAKKFKVVFCCFNDADQARYARLIAGAAVNAGP